MAPVTEIAIFPIKSTVNPGGLARQATHPTWERILNTVLDQDPGSTRIGTPTSGIVAPFSANTGCLLLTWPTSTDAGFPIAPTHARCLTSKSRAVELQSSPALCRNQSHGAGYVLRKHPAASGTVQSNFFWIYLKLSRNPNSEPWHCQSPLLWWTVDMPFRISIRQKLYRHCLRQ